MNLEYDEVFEERGRSYHDAMRRYPTVRSLEFTRAFERHPVGAGQTVLDVPAGGGYLGRLLPHAQLTQLELTRGFGTNLPVVEAGSNWNVGRFDHVVCAAALHHIEDQQGFVRQLLSHAEDGGVVHLLDVGIHSPVAEFLDGFAGAHNGTGHEGKYLTSDIRSLAGNAEILFFGELTCPWLFATAEDLTTFCSGLFGLEGCAARDLEHALRTTVGIDDTQEGVRLNWRLHYADLRSA